MADAQTWAAFGGLISAAAGTWAAFAAWKAVTATRETAQLSQQEARLRSTFEYLNQLGTAGRGLRQFDPEDDLGDQVLHEWDENLGHSPRSRAFLEYLDTLNTVAYAASHQLIDEVVVVDFTKNLANWAPTLRRFIAAYSNRMHDESVYRFAYAFLGQLENAAPVRKIHDRSQAALPGTVPEFGGVSEGERPGTASTEKPEGPGRDQEQSHALPGASTTPDTTRAADPGPNAEARGKE